MTVAPDEVEKLVDPAPIEAANAAIVAARARLAEAQDKQTAAAANLNVLKQARDRAINGDGDPHATTDALQQGEKTAAVADEVLAATKRALEEAETAGIRRARDLAWRPVYLFGIRTRIAAAQKADQARALLAEAESEYKAGTALLDRAYDGGTQHPVVTAVRSYGDPTEEKERSMWSRAGVDPDKGW